MGDKACVAIGGVQLCILSDGAPGDNLWIPPLDLLGAWAGAAMRLAGAEPSPAEPSGTADAGAELRDGIHTLSRRRCELSLRLVDEREMQYLNRQWRGRDRSTNVLSFPVQLPELSDPDHADLTQHWLGDLVICPAVLAQEAKALARREADHWAHLVVHGVLHLLGYDHEDTGTADGMESLEIRILSTLGIADPYHHPDLPQGSDQGQP